MGYQWAINAGEASTASQSHVGNCNNLLVIEPPPPASPLHNIESGLNSLARNDTLVQSETNDPTNDQSLTEPSTQPTINQWAINGLSMRARPAPHQLRDVGNCNNLLVIEHPPPASPLHNLEFALICHLP